MPAVASATDVHAELLNALGQVVKRLTKPLPTAGAQLYFDTGGLAQGVYLLRLKAGAAIITKRVVLQ